MCFSLLASVAAGTTLAVAGAATVRLTRRRAELPLALIPLLFGLQQLTEGVVWWSLRHDAATVRAWSTFAYTMFSHVLWPVFVPLAMYRMESVPWRRRALSACLGLGAGVSFYLLYVLLQSPSASRISESSIQYYRPSLSVIGLYLLATCGSALLSRHLALRIMGATALGLALLTLWLYAAVFVSVWCFFCALLTLMIFVYFWWLRRPVGGASAGPPVLHEIPPSR